MPQTKSQIQAILASAGMRPLKQYGQNFLIDGNLMRKLVAAAEVRSDDVVLEVGPATGSLTEELLAVAGHVVAVEIDKGFQAICRDRLGGTGRLTVIHRDVLERKSAVAAEVLEVLAGRQKQLGGRVMMVANLPYQVATPLVIDLLMQEFTVSPMCFTVQAEVAERLVAPPGGKTYGPISVFAQALATAQRIARLPPDAFWPEPKVDSAMLRMDVLVQERLSPEIREQLARVVHGCFNHRRKTMRWNLRTLLGEAELEQIEADGRWNLDDRPERIEVPQWVQLATLCEQVARQ